MGLQEALKSQIDDLRQRLPEFAWYGVGRDDGREAGEFTPIFYRRDRFELLDEGQFWLCEQPSEPGRIDWGAGCTRITTWVALADRTTETQDDVVRLYFFNTHFDHESAVAREKSARQIRSHFATLDREPVVLTGDFNCRSDSAPIQALTSTEHRESATALSDAFQRAGTEHRGPNSTWNGFRAVRPNHRIDFVFVSPQWQVRSHAILDAQCDGRFLSDHLPVVAELLQIRHECVFVAKASDPVE